MNGSNNQQDGLAKLLKEWRAEAALPPRFQETVWRRIDGIHRRPSIPAIQGLMHWLAWALARRSIAALYVALLVLLGGSIGWTRARQATARMKGELAERYVQILDPYQTSKR